MKQKLLALVLSLTLFLSAGLTTTLSAHAATPEENLTALTERMLAAAQKRTERHGQSEITAFSAAATKKNNIAAIKIGSPTALVNSKKTQIDAGNKKVTPIKKGGRTLVPLRFSATAMGGKTKYISDKDYITVTLGDKIAKFKINSKTLQIVNKKGKVLKKVTLDVAAVKVNGRVQVPLRAVSEGLGCKVYYEKIRNEELVLVSRNKLDSNEKAYSMAELQNLSKYTFTNKEKTYQVTLPGAWNKAKTYSPASNVWNTAEESDDVIEFENPLYYTTWYTFKKISAAEAKKLIGLSATALKKRFADVHNDKNKKAVFSDYKKYTVNGKAAVRFSVETKMENEDESWSTYMDFFFIASNETGLMASTYALKNDDARAQFKTVCNTVKLLK